MDFKMGLVLSLTDNLSAGLNNATKQLNQFTQMAENASSSLNDMASLTAFSFVADRLGSMFIGMGSGIVDTLNMAISKVNSVGSQIFYANAKLSKLYESTGKTGKEVLGDISEYAQKSIFEYEDLIDIVAMLKANGIEAFDSIASSTGNSNQMLMDYAADLAAFNPQMRNVYGTGIKAAMGALNEYIAEGNAMSLKRGASLDILGILGEEKGASIEERSRQVADLIEKLGLVGMTASMAGTPMQRLSNVQDLIFTTITKIADSGVYDRYVSIIQKVTDWVFKLGEAEEGQLSTIDRLVPVIGETITSLMDPIERAIELLLKVGDAFVGIIVANPAILKFITILGAFSGASMIAVGVALKVASALSGLATLYMASGRQFTGVVSLFKSSSLKIFGILKPLGIAIGLFALAWKFNLFGIKDATTTFAKGISESFKTARSMVNGNVNNMLQTLSDLRSKGDFFSNLTIGLTKLFFIFKALGEAWNTNTLSEDTFVKLRTLGLLPLIEAFLDLKYRWENFVDGFKQGCGDVANWFSGMWDSISEKAKGTFLEDIINRVEEFLTMLTSNDAESWKEFGYAISILTGVVAGVLSLLAATKLLIPIFSTVFGIIGKLITGFQMLTKFMLNNPIAMVITGIVTAVASFVSMFKNGFSAVKEAIMVVGIALAAVGAILLGAPALIAGVVAGIVALVATLIIAIKDHWQQIVGFFLNLWETIYSGVTSFIEGVKNIFLSLVDWLNSNVITPIKNFFSGLWGGITSNKSLNANKSNKTLGVNKSNVTRSALPAFATGGVVEKPTTALIGEAGAEAVMPLENNTQWIGILAGMLHKEMGSAKPVSITNVSNQTNGGGYSTTNNRNTTSNITNTSDNSVVFSEGAIVVNVQNAGDDEALRLAKKIMEYIKRQKEITLMTNYG